MKRRLAIALTLALMLCALAAAEPSEAADVNTLIDSGSFIIQISVPDGDMGWIADDMAQDDSVVKLYDADILEDTFVARYDPVGDGDVTVDVRHYRGIACDEAYAWDLRVADGEVREVIGGSHSLSSGGAEQDPLLSGEWVEAETQFHEMFLDKNEYEGWDVVIVSPLTHGAYVFKTTVHYDCWLDAFVYDKGKFFDAPITDSEEEGDLGEAVVAGTTGSLTLEGDDAEGFRIVWWDDENAESPVTFVRAE